MRLLLVDDHPLFLEGLRNLLTGRGIEVVGTARDGFEALAQVRALHPEIVLMDVRMPRCNGLDGTRLIQAEFPEVRVVMLTASTDDEDLFDAIRVGASGYLFKTQDTETFFSSLGELGRGEVTLAPGLVKRIMSEFARRAEPSGADSAGDGGLSPRQIQILTLICRGLTYKEVGHQLGLAERTVKYHMGEILAKLHLKNRSEAVAYARAHALNRGKLNADSNCVSPSPVPPLQSAPCPLRLYFSARRLTFSGPCDCPSVAPADSDTSAQWRILTRGKIPVPLRRST